MAEEFREEPSEELKQFEALLRGCPPAPIHVDRDRFMYLAGQASVEKNLSQATAAEPVSPRVASYKTFAWPIATAALLLLSLTLGAMLFRPPEVRVVYVAQPAPSGPEFASLPALENPTPLAKTAEPNYLQVRNLVLARGIDALPESAVVVSNRPQEPVPVFPLLRHDF